MGGVRDLFSPSDMSFYFYFGSNSYLLTFFRIAFIGIHLLKDVVVPKRSKMLCGAPVWPSVPLPSNAACQLDILGHYGDPFGMDSAEVGIVKEAHQVSLQGLLQSHNGPTLETNVDLAQVLSKFSHQPLERQFTDEEFSGLLVPLDFS